ncbi:MAG: hypothetical protein ACJ76H_09835 [Bacteriovoracaceae bacterium]
MKLSALLFIAVILSSSVRADVGEVFAFGRGNTTAGGMSNGIKLDLERNNESDRYYLFQCKKSSLFKKNHLVFQVIEKGSNDVLTQAETNVDDCKAELKNIYEVAFERNAQIVVALTEVHDEKGVYGMRISENFSVDVVE